MTAINLDRFSALRYRMRYPNLMTKNVPCIQHFFLVHFPPFVLTLFLGPQQFCFAIVVCIVCYLSLHMFTSNPAGLRDARVTV